MGRIIVIEDNPVFRDHVCGMLEKAGYETRTAYDCAGARRLRDAIAKNGGAIETPAPRAIGKRQRARRTRQHGRRQGD